MNASKLIFTSLLGSGLASLAFGQDALATQDTLPVIQFTSSIEQDAEPGFLGVMVGADNNGASIESVVEGSAAAGAGLLAGDRIVAVGDAAIGGREALGGALSNHPAGDTVEIGIERTVSVTLGTHPQTGGAYAGFRLSENPLAVTEAIEGSGAAGAGLQAGDQIVTAGGNALDGFQGVLNYLGGMSPGDSASFGIRRRVQVTLGSRPAPEGAPEVEEEIVEEPIIRDAEISDDFFIGSGEAVDGFSDATQGTQDQPGFLGVGLGADGSVTQIFEGSAAEGAGMQAGDRILRVNGREVFSADDVIGTLGELNAGAKIQVDFERSSGTVRQRFLDVNVTLGVRPENVVPPGADSEPEAPSRNAEAEAAERRAQEMEREQAGLRARIQKLQTATQNMADAHANRRKALEDEYAARRAALDAEFRAKMQDMRAELEQLNEAAQALRQGGGQLRRSIRRVPQEGRDEAPEPREPSQRRSVRDLSVDDVRISPGAVNEEAIREALRARLGNDFEIEGNSTEQGGVRILNLGGAGAQFDEAELRARIREQIENDPELGRRINRIRLIEDDEKGPQIDRLRLIDAIEVEVPEAIEEIQAAEEIVEELTWDITDFESPQSELNGDVRGLRDELRELRSELNALMRERRQGQR